MATVTILTHGFAQPERWSNGMATIRARILEADPDALLICGGWKGDIDDVCRRVAESNATRVVCASHSWGCWWQTLFAAAYGDPIAAMHLADGVGRNPYRGPLIIPPTVVELSTWRKERVGLIRSSDIVAHPPTRWIVDERVDAWHPSVDDDRGFQDAVVEAATA